MFKASLLIAVICTAVVACASTPQPAPKTASVPAGCVQTGSRITGKADQCPFPGRSYSQEEMERTGRFGDVGAALSQLDPSITVHH
jgi:hypothetical protein